jgi:hypothetical protein
MMEQDVAGARRASPLRVLFEALLAAEARNRVRAALRYQLGVMLKHRGGRPDELRCLFDRLEAVAKEDPCVPYAAEASLLDYLQRPHEGGNCHVVAAIAALRAADRDIPGALAIYDAHLEYLRPSMSAWGDGLRRLCSITDLTGVRHAFVRLPLQHAGLRPRRKLPQRDDAWEIVCPDDGAPAVSY